MIAWILPVVEVESEDSNDVPKLLCEVFMHANLTGK